MGTMDDGMLSPSPSLQGEARRRRRALELSMEYDRPRGRVRSYERYPGPSYLASYLTHCAFCALRGRFGVSTTTWLTRRANGDELNEPEARAFV